MLLEKENAPVIKESERLVIGKDTGKQFVSSAAGGASGNEAQPPAEAVQNARDTVTISCV